MESLGKYLLKNIRNYEDRVSYVFLGYFLIYIKYNIKNYHPTSDTIITVLNELLEYFKETLTEKQFNRIEYNYEILGMKRLIEQHKSNRTTFNKVFDKFNQNLSIDNLIDFFEYVSPSDKTLNDFFTPEKISKTMIDISIKKMEDKIMDCVKNKKVFKIYDPTCGIGRLLYYSYVNLKTNYPELIIQCYGIDIFPRYSVFTKSILELINFNNNFIFIGNSLVIDIHQKMDLIISNPPFCTIDKNTSDELNLLRKHYLENKKELEDSEQIELLKMKDVKSINNDDYINIIHNYKEV